MKILSLFEAIWTVLGATEPMLLWLIEHDSRAMPADHTVLMNDRVVWDGKGWTWRVGGGVGRRAPQCRGQTVAVGCRRGLGKNP